MNRASVAVTCLTVVLAACASKSATRLVLTAEQQYVKDVRASVVGSLFVRAKDSDIDALGHGICNLLDQGKAPADVSTSMLTGRKFSEISSADAAFTISAAVHDLCQNHADVIQAWNGAPTPTTSTLPPTTTTLARHPKVKRTTTTTIRRTPTTGA